MANQMMPETLEAISKGSLFAMNLNMLALDEEEEALRQEYKRLKRIIKSKKAAFSVIKYNLDLVRAEYRVRMQVIK